MNKKLILKYFTIILFFSLSKNLIAQGPVGGPDGQIVNQPKVSIGEKGINQLFVSPEVNQLLKVNFIPTNLYTGKLDLEIPLYEIKTGDISVPISLRYNSEGIKIEDEASNVGAGWVLQAGGNVSKIIRDMDDRMVYSRVSGSISSGYTTRAISIGSLAQWAGSTGGVAPSMDMMPDLFVATAPGITSKFYYEKNASTISVKELGGYRNKISYDNAFSNIYNGNLKALAWVGVDKVFPYMTDQSYKNLIQEKVDDIFNNYSQNFSDYSDFSITNTIGTVYKFKTSDVNVAFPTASSYDIFYIGVPDQTKLFWAVRNFLIEKYNITKGTWHLDEISDKTNKKVSFEYASYVNSNITKYPNKIFSGSVTVSNEGGTKTENNTVLYNISSGDIETNGDRSFYSMNALYHYVSKIKWENGEVEFFYEKDREDINNKKALSMIIVRDIHSKIIKKYLFNYGYLSVGPAKRLKLQSVDVFEGINQKRLYDLAYYENTELPLRTSYKKDFLGYFNNSNIVDDMSPENYIPLLHFVRGRKNLSITPFAVYTAAQISGGVRNLEANNYSSTGLLKSIRSRTGGYNEFIYESNSFRFYDQDILGGGSRIVSQSIKNTDGTERKIKYKYIDQSGNSSGSILNLPHYAEISGVKTEGSTDTYRFRTYLRPTGNIELTDGAYVGYERVVEQEEGKGLIEYVYTSPKQFPNTYATVTFPSGSYNNQPLPKTIASSFFPADVFIENDKSGKLLSKKIYDNNSLLLRSEINQYFDKHFGSRSYYTVKQLTNGISSGTTYMYEIYYSLVNSKNLLSSSEVIQYLSNSEIKNKSEYTYANTANSFLTSKKNTSSDNNVEEIFYKYAEDKDNQYLLDKNMIGFPLENETRKNSKILFKQEIIYPINQSDANNKTAGLPLPYSVTSTDLQNTIKEDFSYDKYDSKGNLIQFTDKQKIPTTIIWGYNQTLPIAKIVGGTYAQTMQAFNLNPNDVNSYQQLEIVKKSDLDKDDVSESSLISELNTFKNKDGLKNFQISTYTHDPLIGTKTNISVEGIKKSFRYDDGNRLNKILDNDNKIIQEYNYNYNDLQIVFTNAQRAETFTRNNCNSAGMIPGTYTYIVPAGQYTSNISQADADQKAINDINSNGQNAANIHGICYYPYCEFNSQSSSSYIMMQYAPFQKANTVVNAQLNFQVISNQGLNWSGGVMVGQISSPCWPSSTIIRSSSNWQVTIYAGSGQTVLRWLGTGNPNTGVPYNITFNYDVN
ncbi:DUF5977 domain-containing protein [uncultured Chryseobacterium sp.]|uniref:DUF5977 domain-containing protein n=1 Tax=uncultured Chryseobacterium sp. TaxID=259322 RepID=UPI0025CFBF66|nr:DUF5977 domain-containing protein [uncultured Chryseobacterium sp.]